MIKAEFNLYCSSLNSVVLRHPLEPRYSVYLQCDRCALSANHRSSDNIQTGIRNAVAAARKAGWAITPHWDNCPGCVEADLSDGR